MSSQLFSINKTNWQESVRLLLERACLVEIIDRARPILIKPNLVEALAPPITTPVALVEAIIDFLQQNIPGTRIIVGEGTGSVEYDTFHCFSLLGYLKLAKEKGVELLDLNTEAQIKKTNADCGRWPELYLPPILDEVYLISVPVLKAHSLAGVTLTMKNMMGCASPSHYRQGNSWGKSAFHKGIQNAIFDLNRYRTPDFTILDATVGMAEAHLWGPHCEPPVGRLIAGTDPVAVDAYGCELLGRDWRNVGHIRSADGILGKADDFQVIEL